MVRSTISGSFCRIRNTDATVFTLKLKRRPLNTTVLISTKSTLSPRDVRVAGLVSPRIPGDPAYVELSKKGKIGEFWFYE